ncbi:MAG: hypothetical protein KIT31_06485 [Deltaproteobacteria bacterium]|nr:hypothetical protein [Deltaproteobacteria bacterium]
MALVVLVTTACGSKKATCIEGASVACACPSGQSGAQICDADGKLGPCSCSGSRTSIPTVAKTRRPPSCPSDTDAAVMLARAFKTDDKITVLKCAPGSFPGAGWIFVAWVGDPTADLTPVPSSPNTTTEQALERLSAIKDIARLHHSVISTAGALIADVQREPTFHERDGSESTTWARLEAADLDGDGNDEIVEETEYMRRGWVIGRVEVSLVRRDTLTSALVLQTSYSNAATEPMPGPTTCKATWNVDSRHLVVIAKEASGPRAREECLKGSRTYTLSGDKLVAVP